MIQFSVRGKPVPQGSKNQWGGESSKFLKPWRDSVTVAAVEAMVEAREVMMLGPVILVCRFNMPRPKSHYRSGARAHELKPSAPLFVPTKPDLDKLLRAVGDALTNAGVVRDDCQITGVVAHKKYADGPPSMDVTVISVPEAQALKALDDAASEIPQELIDEFDRAFVPDADTEGL